MKLYCFPRSGNSREVKLALYEKNLKFEAVNVHDPAFNKEDAEFKKASPKGEVPAIIDGATYLANALDINLYLEDKYPSNPLLPTNKEKRAEVIQWIRDMDKKLTVPIGLYIVECLLKPKEKQSDEAKAKLKAKIVSGLHEADLRFEGKDFFFGTLTLADISLVPHISALGRVQMAVEASTYPRLKVWLERLQTRPSFAASAN